MDNIQDNEYDALMKLKRQIVFKQYFELDEKDYIPAEDFFFMLETPDMFYTPKNFIESAREYPEEFLEYINAQQKICDYDTYYNSDDDIKEETEENKENKEIDDISDNESENKDDDNDDNDEVIENIGREYR